MLKEFLIPEGRVVYTDEWKAFLVEQEAGTCLLTTVDSGLSGADGYVECREDLEELTQDYLSRIYDRHMGRPHELIRMAVDGKTLLVRELSGEDYEAFLVLCSQGGVGLSGYESSKHFARELEQYRKMDEAERKQCSKRFGRQVLQNYRILDYGLWLLLKEGQPIGLAGLMPEEDGVYLGYLLDEAHRGRGIITRICREIVHYAAEELGINRLFARTAVDNLPSQAVLRHLEFTVCRDMAGGIKDTVLYELRI